MPGPWECASRPGDIPHVMPVDDYMPHTMLSVCWCRPQREADVWVHNSMDRREDYETGRLRLN